MMYVACLSIDCLCWVHVLSVVSLIWFITMSPLYGVERIYNALSASVMLSQMFPDRQQNAFLDFQCQLLISLLFKYITRECQIQHVIYIACFPCLVCKSNAVNSSTIDTFLSDAFYVHTEIVNDMLMLIVLCTHHCYLQSGSILCASYGVFPRRSDCQKTAHCSMKHFHPPCRFDRPLLFLVCQCIVYKPNTGNNIFLNDYFFGLRILLFYEYDIQFCHFDFFTGRKVLL